MINTEIVPLDDSVMLLSVSILSDKNIKVSPDIVHSEDINEVRIDSEIHNHKQRIIKNTNLLIKSDLKDERTPLNVQGTNKPNKSDGENGTNNEVDTDVQGTNKPNKCDGENGTNNAVNTDAENDMTNDSDDWIVKYDPRGEAVIITKKPMDHSVDIILAIEKGCRKTKLESDYKETY